MPFTVSGSPNVRLRHPVNDVRKYSSRCPLTRRAFRNTESGVVPHMSEWYDLCSSVFPLKAFGVA